MVLAAAVALPVAQRSTNAAAMPVPATATHDDVLAGPRGLDPDRLVKGEEAAYQAYMRGKRAHEGADFDAALVAFGDALRLLPDERPYARSRGSLALWIAQCHAQIYGLRGDLEALAAERTVLEAYAARLGEIATDATDRSAKQALVDARMKEIDAERQRVSGEHGDADAQIDRSLRGDYEGVTASSWAPRVEDLAWYRRRDDPRARSRQADDVDPQPQVVVTDEPGRRKGTGLIAGGAVALGVGVAALAVMGAGMARARAAESFSPTQSPDDRRQQISQGLSGNAMAVSGAVAGAVFVVAGAVMVGIGAKRRRADVPSVAVSPSVSRRHAGISLQVRF